MTRRVLRLDIDGGARFYDIAEGKTADEVLGQVATKLRPPAGYRVGRTRIVSERENLVRAVGRYVKDEK
jgi:hypothetical protein